VGRCEIGLTGNELHVPLDERRNKTICAASGSGCSTVSRLVFRRDDLVPGDLQIDVVVGAAAAAPSDAAAVGGLDVPWRVERIVVIAPCEDVAGALLVRPHDANAS
jgi:hypothetical protein